LTKTGQPCVFGAWNLARPAAGVTVVTDAGGAGMAPSFGLAEKIVKENLGED
jgi:hypothetical protein